jgi:uncharacterized protein with LGFP repeats
VTITGDDFRWAFGLRSSWFTVEPTPIISRWTRIGGAESPLGAVRNPEYAGAYGAAPRVEGGRIFYTTKTGARVLYGRVLRGYRRAGGPRGDLGFPRSRVLRRGPHRLARFQGGSVYARRGTAPVVVTGAIDRRFLSERGLRSGLGWPTTSNYEVAGGERADYQNGSITWTRKSGETTIAFD